MTRTISRWLALLVVALSVSHAAAQSRTAEVRTWDGQTFQLAEPTLDVYYTIAPPPKDGNALPDAERRQGPAANRTGTMISLDALKPLLDKRPDVAMQHHRAVEAVTIVRNNIEVSVPLERLTSLTFFRHPVRSTLPPYVAPEHRRYTAVAVLVDGSRVEGDINLGWTYVRGTAAQGRVDLPWDLIEVIRFR